MTLGTCARVLGIGAATGLRTFAPAATVSGTARSRWAPLLAVAAGAELCVDKLPVTPSRLEPGGLGARIVSGGWSGGELAARSGGSRAAGAFLGALGAVGGAFAGHALRIALVKRGFPDFAVAVAEDAATLVVSFACR